MTPPTASARPIRPKDMQQYALHNLTEREGLAGWASKPPVSSRIDRQARPGVVLRSMTKRPGHRQVQLAGSSQATHT